MLITVEELQEYISTEKPYLQLKQIIQALEISIRKYTNNSFQHLGYRKRGDIAGGIITVEALCPFKVGDTVQISKSKVNDGLYTVKEADETWFSVNEDIVDETDVLVTKVVYPLDVKMGAVEIIKWKLKNEAQNSGDTSAKEIQSETISRHSVTYVQDATESDIDESFGVPKKYTAFLKHYVKGRF